MVLQCVLALLPMTACVLACTCASAQSLEPKTLENRDLPEGSIFSPPPANACASRYDLFYGNEPGVYAYWALCETGVPAQIHDYVGDFDLTDASKQFGHGAVQGGAPGPVPDGETAGAVSTADVAVISQGIPVNSHEGTVALWLYAEPTQRAVSAATFSAQKGKSSIDVQIGGPGDGLCIQGIYTDSSSQHSQAKSCGVAPHQWHRVVFTWKQKALHLWIDGASAAESAYSGDLEDKVYYYRLFPGCCPTPAPMRLAKVLIANRAWSQENVHADHKPTLPPIPDGGVYVSAERLGVIHRDVLGFADDNQQIEDPIAHQALLKGLHEAGFTSVRYASGYGGINADLGDWRGGPPCTAKQGETGRPARERSGNTLDSYASKVLSNAGLDVVYTVNYGTNPPDCNAGGDPKVNARDLVHYAKQKGYKIHSWEIGNEIPATTTETDFHADPHTGSSYVQNEPAFYDAIKAEDPESQVAVPIGLSTYNWQTFFDLPVLAQARYDAVIWHNYPMLYPVTDGDTLYQDRVEAHMRRTHGELLKLQTELLSHGKSADAIWITEWNAEVNGFKWTRQTLGAVVPLFTAIQLAEYMQAGVRMADWWLQGRPNVCSTLNFDEHGGTAYNWYGCGATAAIYTGPVAGVGEVEVGLKPGDLLPSSRAFQLLSESGFVTEGEHMLRTHVDPRSTPWLLAFAATHGQAHAVLLINRDRDAAHTVPVELAETGEGRKAEQWTYGRVQYDLTRHGDWSAAPVHTSLGAWKKSLSVTLPPWSMSVIVLE